MPKEKKRTYRTEKKKKKNCVCPHSNILSSSDRLSPAFPRTLGFFFGALDLSDKFIHSLFVKISIVGGVFFFPKSTLSD